MGYALAADAVAILHALYAGLIVAGQAAILWGASKGAPWVRHFWLRTGHLAAIAVVPLEDAAGVTCPLTLAEKWLRVQGGQTAYPGDFLAHWAHQALFFQAPPWFFVALHVGFAAVVLGTLLVFPPAWPRLARVRA